MIGMMPLEDLHAERGKPLGGRTEAADRIRSPRSRAAAHSSAIPLMPAPPTPMKWRRRWRVSNPLARASLMRRRAPSSQYRNKLARSCEPRRASPPCAPARPSRTSRCGSPTSSRNAARDSHPAARRRRRSRAAPRRSSTRALSSCWRSRWNGYGTKIAGRPASATSETVIAPERATTRSARASAAAMSSINGTTCASQPSAAVPTLHQPHVRLPCLMDQSKFYNSFSQISQSIEYTYIETMRAGRSA